MHAVTVYVPAMDQYWFVFSSPLHLCNLLNDINDCLEVGAGAVGRPAGHMKLSHLLGQATLECKMHERKQQKV